MRLDRNRPEETKVNMSGSVGWWITTRGMEASTTAETNLKTPVVESPVFVIFEEVRVPICILQSGVDVVGNSLPI